MYKINEVANTFNISKRTLQYYDEIGLLSPIKNNNGYREYKQKDIDLLTTIMIYKELEIPLKEIKEIIKTGNSKEILKEQRNSVKEKIKKYKNILKLLNNFEEEGNKMSDIKKAFNEKEHIKYKEEAQNKYGDRNEYKESNKRWSSYSKNERQAVIDKGNNIFKEINELKHLGFDSKEVQEKVLEYKNHISKYFYECTIEIYKGLGNMYIEDEKFTNNLNKVGEDFAIFLSKAVLYYCNNI